MHIKNTEKINNRILEMWEERNFQGRIDAALFKSISENDMSLENIEPVKAAAKRFIEAVAEKGGRHVTEDEAIMAIMLRSFVDNVAPGSFRNTYEEGMTLSSAAAHSRIFEENEFEENAYLKNIRISDEKEGRFRLTTKKYEPYRFMFYDAPYYLKGTSISLPSVGCFKNEFSYPCIVDGNTEWMSITPYEIYTMQEHIDKAKGNVLLLGCGIGYYAYMTSCKEDVSSITIIEKNKDIAGIFKNYILPQFENKDKITVLEEDAFAFFEELPDGKFDTCFADIYEGMGNFDFYYRLREVFCRFKKMKVSYLHEESFLSYAVSFAALEIMESFARERKAANTIFPNIPEREKRLKTYISRLLKNEEIEKAEDVNYYLNTKNLLKLMNKSKEEY